MNQTPDTFPALFWGYTVIWALLVIYVISLSCRIKKIEAALKSKNE